MKRILVCQIIFQKNESGWISYVPSFLWRAKSRSMSIWPKFVSEDLTLARLLLLFFHYYHYYFLFFFLFLLKIFFFNILGPFLAHPHPSPSFWQTSFTFFYEAYDKGRSSCSLTTPNTSFFFFLSVSFTN